MTNTGSKPMSDNRKALIERLKATKENIRLTADGLDDHWLTEADDEAINDAIAALSAEPSPDAAQGGEHGGEVPQDVLDKCLRYMPGDTDIRRFKLALNVVIAWDRQNRAPQPVQKPVASGMWLLRVKPKFQQGRGKYERAEHRGYTDDILNAGRFTEAWAKKCAADCPDKIEAIPDPYTSPQPVQGGDEGIDEGMVSVPQSLLRRLALKPWEQDDDGYHSFRCRQCGHRWYRGHPTETNAEHHADNCAYQMAQSALSRLASK